MDILFFPSEVTNSELLRKCKYWTFCEEREYKIGNFWEAASSQYLPCSDPDIKYSAGPASSSNYSVEKKSDKNTHDMTDKISVLLSL